MLRKIRLFGGDTSKYQVQVKPLNLESSQEDQRDEIVSNFFTSFPASSRKDAKDYDSFLQVFQKANSIISEILRIKQSFVKSDSISCQKFYKNIVVIFQKLEKEFVNVTKILEQHDGKFSGLKSALFFRFWLALYFYPESQRQLSDRDGNIIEDQLLPKQQEYLKKRRESLQINYDNFSFLLSNYNEKVLIERFPGQIWQKFLQDKRQEFENKNLTFMDSVFGYKSKVLPAALLGESYNNFMREFRATHDLQETEKTKNDSTRKYGICSILFHLKVMNELIAYYIDHIPPSSGEDQETYEENKLIIRQMLSHTQESEIEYLYHRYSDMCFHKNYQAAKDFYANQVESCYSGLDRLTAKFTNFDAKKSAVVGIKSCLLAVLFLHFLDNQRIIYLYFRGCNIEKDLDLKSEMDDRRAHINAIYDELKTHILDYINSISQLPKDVVTFGFNALEQHRRPQPTEDTSLQVQHNSLSDNDTSSLGSDWADMDDELEDGDQLEEGDEPDGNQSSSSNKSMR